MRDSGAPLNLVVGRKAGMEVNRNSSIFVSSILMEAAPAISGLDCWTGSFIQFSITHLRIILSRRARMESLDVRRCEQRSLADKSLSWRECLRRKSTSTPVKEAILAGLKKILAGL